MSLPLGYRYAATYAGIRKVRKNDLALIFSDRPAAAAAIFTRNLVQAAPVRLGRAHLKATRGKLRAILVNAGNANCATRTGEKVALASCRAAARLLRISSNQVLPSSTGVIGVELDGKLILNALPGLVAGLAPDNFAAAAEAIMTTDTFLKTATADVALRGGVVHIAGMTKGAGMIHPDMATMLGFLMTDAAISAAQLRPLLAAAANRSYHCLSVDGDMSTNDTLALMANGASGVALTSPDRSVFSEALTRLCQELASRIAKDGEGAKKLVTIIVRGARTDEDAAKIARAIANSPLVKTAIAGSDPNWGRILSAAGYSGAFFDPVKVDIYLQGVPVCLGGLAAHFSEAELTKKLDQTDCLIDLRIRGSGRGAARFWTCDLTHGYIDVNASYRT